MGASRKRTFSALLICARFSQRVINMGFKSVKLLFCIICVVQSAVEQSSTKRKNGKKDSANSAAIDELKKQIDEIVQDLNLIKEHQSLQTVCLKGIKIPGKCFLADPIKKTFHTANDDCIAKGGTLSSPLSGDENDQLYAYVRQTIGPEEHIWLGINDILKEGEWMDQTSSTIRFKNWESEITHQPDGGRSQNCAILSSNANGKWFDENCRAEKASVCQFNIV
ncbi:putative tetranectin [Triplophysa rosa]|uniref:Tetranectin n=1 Tax=Triplophysa rosa TaxID=992332 RepID=A0A9W7W868_TRIRA|nr:putative tetranectin [Triplophysa rosa]